MLFSKQDISIKYLLLGRPTLSGIVQKICASVGSARYNARRKEIQFPCRKCSHPSFFFSVSKLVGYCHRCHWKPRLQDLNAYLKRPVDAAEAEAAEPVQHDPGKISLPAGSQALLVREGGRFHTINERAIGEIAARGVSIPDQFQFGFRLTQDRIILPVVEGGTLVNYLARLIWWLPFLQGRKYLYCPGVSTSRYLFNWDEAKRWERLGLVENTFNGIAYRGMGITSSFGSHLSAHQIEHIAKGKAKSVVLLWDEGAEARAEKAVKELAQRGVPAAFVRMKGQPDSHPVEQIQAWLREGHKAAGRGKLSI